ncbi:hypothetical protein L9F63_015805, partial [Diploptera punctata]
QPIKHKSTNMRITSFPGTMINVFISEEMPERGSLVVRPFAINCQRDGGGTTTPEEDRFEAAVITGRVVLEESSAVGLAPPPLLSNKIRTPSLLQREIELRIPPPNNGKAFERDYFIIHCIAPILPRDRETKEKVNNAIGLKTVQDALPVPFKITK